MSVSYPSLTLPDPTPFGLKLNSSLSLSYWNLFPDPDPPQIPLNAHSNFRGALGVVSSHLMFPCESTNILKGQYEGEGGREREKGSKDMAVPARA